MSRHSTGAARRRDWAPPRVLPAGAPASRRNAQGATLQAGEGLPCRAAAGAWRAFCCAWPASAAAAGARGLPAFPGARRLTRPRPSERGRASTPARARGTARCRLPGTSGNFPELEARAGKGHGAMPAELATPARSKCPRCCLAAGAPAGCRNAPERPRTRARCRVKPCPCRAAAGRAAGLLVHRRRAADALRACPRT